MRHLSNHGRFRLSRRYPLFAAQLNQRRLPAGNKFPRAPRVQLRRRRYNSRTMANEFTMNRRVQFAETDVAGVLHFSNYYRMMEEAECALWRSLGVNVMHPHNGGHMSWPRVATQCEYFSPAHLDDELSLSMVLVHVGQRSVSFECDFRRGEERIALGRSTAVCCFMKGGGFEAMAIPDFVRAKLTPLLAEGHRKT